MPGRGHGILPPSVHLSTSTSKGGATPSDWEKSMGIKKSYKIGFVWKFLVIISKSVPNSSYEMPLVNNGSIKDF